MDYVHYNPVKHGWVTAVKDWPFSTFNRWVRAGVYPLDWAGNGGQEAGGFGERSEFPHRQGFPAILLS
jgi:putative transposase